MADNGSRGARRAAAPAGAAPPAMTGHQARVAKAAAIQEAKNAAAYAAVADAAWLGAIPAAPTFYPTEEEAADPVAYVRSISPEASRFGIAKVVVPYPAASAQFEKLMRGEVTGCTPLNPASTFQTRIQPVALQTWRPPLKTGIWWLSDKQHTLSSYSAEAAKYAKSVYGDCQALPPVRTVEADLWRARSAAGEADRAALARARHDGGAGGEGGAGGGGEDGAEPASRSGGRGSAARTIFYGDNVHGSLFLDRQTTGAGGAPPTPSPCPLSASRWNLRRFAANPGSLLAHAPDIPGVTTPMLYIGMLHSSFAWHVEDNNLLSINYGHGGFPKVWYGVPAAAADALEAVAAERVYGHDTLGVEGGDAEGARAAAATALAAKTTIFSPRLLLEAGVPVCRAVQEAGSFIITWPRAYHSGFSAGFHVGEAVNFATPEWLPWGGLASGVYGQRRAPPIVHVERLWVDALARAAVAELGRGAVGGALLRRAAASAAEGGEPPADRALAARLARSERAAVLVEGAAQLRALASARASLAACEAPPPPSSGTPPKQAGHAPSIPVAPREAVSVCEACGQGAALLRVFCHAGCGLCARCAAGGAGPVPLPAAAAAAGGSSSEGEDEGDAAAAAARAARAALSLPLPPGAGVVHVSPEWEPALAAWGALAAAAGAPPGVGPAAFDGSAVSADLMMDLGGLGAERAALVGLGGGALPAAAPQPAAAAAAAAAARPRGGGRAGAGPTPSPRGGGGGGVSTDTARPTPAAAHPPRARPGTADPAPLPRPGKAAAGGAAGAADAADPPPPPPRAGRPLRAAAALANERLREGASAEAGGVDGPPAPSPAAAAAAVAGGGSPTAAPAATPPRRPSSGLASPPRNSGGGRKRAAAAADAAATASGASPPRPAKRGAAAPAAGSSKPTPRRRAAADKEKAAAADEEKAAAAVGGGSEAASPPRPSPPGSPADSQATITVGSGPPPPRLAAARSPTPGGPPAFTTAPERGPAAAAAVAAVPGPPAARAAPRPPAPAPGPAPPPLPPLPRGATYLVSALPPPASRPRPLPSLAKGQVIPADVPLAAYQRRVYARAPGSDIGPTPGPADGSPWPDLSPTDPAHRLIHLADVYTAWSGGRGANPTVMGWVTAVAGAGAAVPPPARAGVLPRPTVSTMVSVIGRACTAKLYAALQDPAAKGRLKAFVEGVWGDGPGANPCGSVDDFLLVGYSGGTPEEGKEGAGGGPEGYGDDEPGSSAPSSPPRLVASPRRPSPARGPSGGGKRPAAGEAPAAPASRLPSPPRPPAKKRDASPKAAAGAPEDAAQCATPPRPAAAPPVAPRVGGAAPAPPPRPPPAAANDEEDDDDGKPIIAAARRPGLMDRLARLGGGGGGGAAGGAPVVRQPVAVPGSPLPAPVPGVVVVPTLGVLSDRTPKVGGFIAAEDGATAAVKASADGPGGGVRGASWHARPPPRLLSSFGRACDAAGAVGVQAAED